MENNDSNKPPWWSVFEDNEGGFSSMRIAFLLWIFIFVSRWLYISIQTGSLTEIPQSLITFTLGLGVAKVGQRFCENSGNVLTKLLEYIKLWWEKRNKEKV